MKTRRFAACAALWAMLANLIAPSAVFAQSAQPTLGASPLTAATNVQVSFTLKIPSAASVPQSYTFAFGDGATQIVLDNPVYGAGGFSATASAQHAYANAGTYKVTASRPVLESPVYSTSIVITASAPVGGKQSPSPTPALSPPPATPTPILTPPPAPSKAPATPVPTAAPTSALTSAPPSNTPPPTSIPRAPTPNPTPTPIPVATVVPTAKPTVAPTVTPQPIATIVPGVRTATIETVRLTWPNGAREYAAATDGRLPHPVAHIAASPGRITLQWIVDGTLFKTVVQDVNGSEQTFTLDDPLPIGAANKPHRVEIAIIPQAEPFATPPPAQQISYSFSAKSAVGYGGAPPVPKATPFSTAGLHVGILTLRAPAWGKYEGDSGYKHKPSAGADVGVPLIDDSLHFAWREQNPGTAETFVIRFFDARKKEIASQTISERTYVPEAAFLTTLLGAAGPPSPDRISKRVADQTAGQTSLASGDITWQVEGLHQYAGASGPTVVERSERWPLAAPSALTVAAACPAHSPGKLGTLQSSITAKPNGNDVALTGSFSFANSPYAPDDVQFTGSNKSVGTSPEHARVFSNVLVDWGDGTLEPLSARGGGATSGAKTEPLRVRTEHIYTTGGSQEIRVFVVPTQIAERDSVRFADEEKSGFPIFCGSVDTVGNDLNLISTEIVDAPGVSTSGVNVGGTIIVNGKSVHASTKSYVFPSNCTTETQVYADLAYTGEGDIDVHWGDGDVVLANEKVHVAADKYNDPLHPSILHLISPRLTASQANGTRKVTVSVRSASKAQLKGASTTLGATAPSSSVCALTFATSHGGSYTIDNVKTFYSDTKAQSLGRLSGTGTLEFFLSDGQYEEIPMQIPISFVGWKVDLSTGIVHDGVLHTDSSENGVALHGITWKILNLDSKLVQDAPDDMNATVALAPAASAGKLSIAWPKLAGIVQANGVFSTQFGGDGKSAIDVGNGWSVDNHYVLSADSSKYDNSDWCNGYQPVSLGYAQVIPDKFMQLVGVTAATTTKMSIGDNGLCADVALGASNASQPNGSIAVKAFEAFLVGGKVDARPEINATVTKPAMFTGRESDIYKYTLNSGATESGITGEWLFVPCNGPECGPSGDVFGTAFQSQDVSTGSAVFSMAGVALVAAPNPAGGFVPALYGDFNELVSRYSSQVGIPPDLRASIDFGPTTVGIGGEFVSFANNVPYETVTPTTTNVNAQTAIPSTGLSGYVQRDGTTFTTELHGMQPGNVSAEPVTYAWQIEDYSVLYGPKIDVPNAEVEMPAGAPRVHAIFKIGGIDKGGSSGNSGSPGWCGAADFSMMTGDEMQGVFYYDSSSASWLVSAGIGFGGGGPEIIPGIAVLEGVGGGAGYGINKDAFRTAVKQLGGKTTIESNCTETFAPDPGMLAINAQAQVGDASGLLYTVVGNMTAGGGSGDPFVVQLDAGAFILQTSPHTFALGDDGSGAPIAAHLKFAGDSLGGNVTVDIPVVPPDIVKLKGDMNFAFGSGTFDINAADIGVTIPFFGAVNGRFDFNPNSIAAGVTMHYEQSAGCCGVSADYYFDAAADVLISRAPVNMRLDASLDVGGDLCLFFCAGLSVGGGVTLQYPLSPTVAIHIDLPDPIGTINL